MLKRMHVLASALMVILLSSCGGPAPVSTQTSGVDIPTTEPTETAEIPSNQTPTPQPTHLPETLGPNREDFPAGVNPLSGLPVTDPSLMKIPALLVSISNFPATARPQAGLSFAPWVFEFSITEGQNRFLAAFYGEFPAPEIPVTGDCEVRSGAFKGSDLILGNQVWLDINSDGVQNINERGVGGVCVNLYNAAGEKVQSTTTDSNGYYGFNVEPGHYTVEVVKPAWANFTEPNLGEEEFDSDTDQESGRMEADISSTLLSLDAGLVPSNGQTPTPNPDSVMPNAEVGPVRSGRLLYAHIGNFFQDSCLIYAFASEEVLSQIPKCAFVTHETYGGGSMISLERLRAVAEDNARKNNHDFNYANNLFKEDAPAGGVPASQINVYFALLNQAGWTYDPLYGAYLRYVDTSEKERAGELHPEVDRLTGRQLHFENVIVIFAEHEVIRPTNLNIHLDQGELNQAFLFRDGMMYPIKWSTLSGEYEKKTGFRRPIHFQNLDGTPAALKPGHTWILIVTPFSPVTEISPGVWKVRYSAPEGEAQ